MNHFVHINQTVWVISLGFENIPQTQHTDSDSERKAKRQTQR